MSFETAKMIVDKEMKMNDGYTSVIFELFGGEPFLAFKVVKQIVEYLEETYSDGERKFFCYLTTNGTLVKAEQKEWLLKHQKTVGCGLSLDGPQKLHDINRCNSFKDIDLDFFLKTYPTQSVKMTISKETLPYLYECVTFAQNYI